MEFYIIIYIDCETDDAVFQTVSFKTAQLAILWSNSFIIQGFSYRMQLYKVNVNKDDRNEIYHLIAVSHYDEDKKRHVLELDEQIKGVEYITYEDTD